MRGRTILAIVVIGALIAIAVIGFYRLEPRYKGRTLSQWLKAHSAGDPQAREAIVIISSNSAPELLRALFADTGPNFYLINKLPFSISQHRLVRPILYRESETFRAACALRAFEIAGTNATSAIPALAAMTTDSNSQPVKVLAFHVLSLIGPPAVPTIRHAMSSPDPYARFAAVGALRRIGTNANEAIPDIVRALSDQDIFVRQNATNALETLYPQLLTNTPPQ